MDACIRAETPSAKNRKCQQFSSAMPRSDWPSGGRAVMVEYGGSKRKRTICYSGHSGEQKQKRKGSRNTSSSSSTTTNC